MIDSLDFDFLIRLLINMVGIYVLVRLIYFRATKQRAYASSYILFGLGVFLITSQLASVEISMGFAFGLFAIFSMLRYRTESINIKEMTYLFLVISMSLLSGVSASNHLELALLLSLICIVVHITETSLLMPQFEEYTVEYEKIENIVPERREELLEDLRERLGLDVRTVQIESVNFLRDTASLKIQYAPDQSQQ